MFLDFLDMTYTKEKTLTPHTYVQGTIHIDHVCQVEPIAKLRPTILLIIDEHMSHYQHHMTHHIGAMPRRNKILHTKILIMSDFVSYGKSLMRSIKT